MDLSKYLSKKVRIDLVNNYFYEGTVLNIDDDSLELKDRTNKLVSIKFTMISFIREIK